MTIGKSTKLSPIEIGYKIDARLPVIPLAMQIKRAACAGPHAHPRGQFIYASNGTMRVICDGNIWVVPPSQAVWVPPNTDHEVHFPAEVSLRNLFIDPSATSCLPSYVMVLEVSSLLRELVLKAVRIGDAYTPGCSGWRLMQVLIDEIGDARQAALRLPMGRDERIVRVIEVLLNAPGDARKLDDWAAIGCVSSRTLSRLFVSETGLSFGAWRKQLRLINAIEDLGSGRSVTEIAYDLGYKSPSAFIEMFRQSLGTPPGQYFRGQRRG